MRTRSLIILTIVGFGIGAGGYLLSDVGPLPISGTQQTGRLLFPDLTARLTGARQIIITQQGKTLRIVLSADGRWGIADRHDYPARIDRIRELLTGLTELRVMEARTADPTQWHRLGVDNPADAGSSASLLRILDADGSPLLELIVGRRRMRVQGNVPESVYVRRPDENQSWLAEGRLPVDADNQLWLDRDIANIPGARVMRVEVTRDAGTPPATESLVITRNADGALTVPSPAEHPALDTYRLEDTARAFEMLAFIDVAPAAQAPQHRVGTSVFTLDNGVRITAQVTKRDDEVWVQLAASGEGAGEDEARQLQARFEGWAFRVGVWKEQALTPRLADLSGDPAQTPPAESPPPSDAPPAGAQSAPARGGVPNINLREMLLEEDYYE